MIGPRLAAARIVALLLPHVRRRLPQGELTRGVLILVTGTVVAQGLLVLTSPILTRLYSPSDLGALSVYTAITSVLITVTSLSYELAIPLPEDDADAANVLALSLGLILSLSTLAALALFAVGEGLLESLGVPSLAPYAPLIAVGQLSGGVAASLAVWAIRTRHFPALASTQVVQSATLATFQITIGLLRVGAIGLVGADIVSRAAASVSLGSAAWRGHAPALRQISFRGVRRAAVRYRRFPMLSTPSALLNTLGLQAPSLLVVAHYGTEVGGQLFLAQRIAALPVTLLARSVSQVYTSEAARIVREDPTRLRSLFNRTTRSLARAGALPALLVAVAAPILFGPVFGEEWRQAGWFTALLVPVYFLTLMTSPTGATLDVLERQDLHFVREFVRLVFVGGAVIIAAAVRLPPIGAIIVLSLAGCLTYGMYGLISWWAIISNQRHPRRTGRPL